jgi:methylated-DNA-[protein]-cysteine S-methyltransferase
MERPAGTRSGLQGFAIFATPIGGCGVAWSDRGLVGTLLPEPREAATRARLQRRYAAAQEAPPPPGVQRAIEAITALLHGQGDVAALDAIDLDMARVAPFPRRVYEIARAIPPGKTLTYGEIAARLGEPGRARDVGQALGRNPFPLVVPCHRVLAAGGKLGGFSAPGGVTTKHRLLTIEGTGAGGQLGLFDGDGAFGFDPEAAVAHLRSADPVLARTMDAVGPFTMRLKRAPSIFAALAEAIVYQQLHGRAAASIHARLCALFPRGHEGPTAEGLLRASEARLRAVGLSGAKLLSLRDLARRAVAGEVPTLTEARAMDDEALVERLSAVRGIGRWTVEMLLMFRLGRADVLPVDDYGIRQGFQVAFRKRAMPAREVVAKHGERWRPYRTVASWYLWRAAERAKREP